MRKKLLRWSVMLSLCGMSSLGHATIPQIESLPAALDVSMGNSIKNLPVSKEDILRILSDNGIVVSEPIKKQIPENTTVGEMIALLPSLGLSESQLVTVKQEITGLSRQGMAKNNVAEPYGDPIKMNLSRGEAANIFSRSLGLVSGQANGQLGSEDLFETAKTPAADGSQFLEPFANVKQATVGFGHDRAISRNQDASAIVNAYGNNVLENGNTSLIGQRTFKEEMYEAASSQDKIRMAEAITKSLNGQMFKPSNIIKNEQTINLDEQIAAMASNTSAETALADLPQDSSLVHQLVNALNSQELITEATFAALMGFLNTHPDISVAWGKLLVTRLAGEGLFSQVAPEVLAEQLQQNPAMVNVFWEQLQAQGVMTDGGVDVGNDFVGLVEAMVPVAGGVCH